MAMTHDYLEYLDEQIGISPAGSQEELQAAQTISDLMKQHDVDTEIEEFDARSFSKLGPAVILALLFVGAFCLAIGSGAVTVIGLLLVAATMVVLVLRYLGTDLLNGLGPTTRSQNVVACHAASGELAAKGNRPIVIVAHYDAPHESFLYSSVIARYVPALRKYSPYCALVVAFCAFVRILVFIPAPFRRVISWVGLVAAIPLLILAIGVLAERFSPCTLGANDNKASVAAMLGVLEKVRPTGKAPVTHRPRVTPALSAAPQVSEPEPVLGVRHGREVVESLGILPETCEVDYVDTTPTHEPTKRATVVSEGDETSPIDVPAQGETTSNPGEADAARTAGFGLIMDDPADNTLPDKDASGLYNSDEAFDLGDTQPAAGTRASKPAAPEDPDWGKTTYVPKVSSVARRAALFDLPDPSEATVDPFAADPDVTRAVTPQNFRDNMAQKLAQNNTNNAHRIQASGNVSTSAPDSSSTPVAERPEIPVISSSSMGPEPTEKKHRFRIFGNKRASSDNDEWDDDPNGWKGGAATRSGLRMVDDGDDPSTDAVSDEELRDAVLSMDDDELVSHDIWFVALGASDIDHAGMKAFLGKHRAAIRGAFMINLNCVGAGNLSALSREGLLNVRRSDRRLMRLLSGTASDLHVPLTQVAYDQGDTDATPAMKQSVRAITLVGIEDTGMPALSHTAADTLENVDADQAAMVAELVTEMIRRS